MVSDNPTASDATLGFIEQWLNDVGRLSADDLKRARRWLTMGGVVGLIAGIVAVAVPAIASVTISIFIGWLLVMAGGAMISHALGRQPVRVTLRVIEGIVTLLIGAYIVIFPLTGTISLTFALTVWLFASGVLQVAAAVRETGLPGRGLTAFSGAVSVFLGVLIAVSWPSSSAWAIGLLVGIDLVFWGIRVLTAAWLLRSLTSESPSQNATGLVRGHGAAGAT
jgi:uncharacterized membrane protein HdeD (DUF308 family)